MTHVSQRGYGCQEDLSDLEFELDPVPAVGAAVIKEVAGCVKVQTHHLTLLLSRLFVRARTCKSFMEMLLIEGKMLKELVSGC